MAKTRITSDGGPPVGKSEKAKTRPSAWPPVRVVPKKPVMSAMRLRLGEVVAEGGMSVIRAAGDANLLREAVAKIPTPQREEEKDELYGRLVEEAQITAQLDHPNIVPVHEIGFMADGTPFFVMKWVCGRNLPNQQNT